jgi:hypothetical protein
VLPALNLRLPLQEKLKKEVKPGSVVKTSAVVQEVGTNQED